ncbi:MAG: hypothetical protein LBI27_08350 [Clostridiales bacterium]|jgi:hypothetical protein|nr:hypothetical protein [Clostridiales bacterium]
MKKLLCIVIAAAFVFMLPSFEVSAENPQIRINGVFIEIPDDEQQPLIVDGRTLVPLRAVMEALGFEVEWNEPTIKLTKPWYEIVIEIGSDEMLVNGVAHSLDVPAQIIGGRTMVPLRAVSEAADLIVVWNEAEAITNLSTEEYVFDNLLFLPAALMEVTLWFGSLDHLSPVQSHGINIQNRWGEGEVFAVANGTVAQINESNVFLNFEHNGTHMQAVYGNINPRYGLMEGANVNAGDIIGRMTTHYVELRVGNLDRLLFELEIRQSTNGEPVNSDNYVHVNPAQFFDLSEMRQDYLNMPMANFFVRNARLQGIEPSEADIRYAQNEDIQGNDFYLRRFVEFCYYSNNYAARGIPLDERILYYDPVTEMAIVYMYGGVHLFPPEGMTEEEAYERYYKIIGTE